MLLPVPFDLCPENISRHAATALWRVCVSLLGFGLRFDEDEEFDGGSRLLRGRVAGFERSFRDFLGVFLEDDVRGGARFGVFSLSPSSSLLGGDDGPSSGCLTSMCCSKPSVLYDP